MKKQYSKFAKEYMRRRQDKAFFNYNRLIEIPCMIKAVGKVGGKTILDLGAGFGDHALSYSKKGAKRIVGVEIIKEFLDFAKSRKIKNTEFYYGDISKKLKFKSNSFDIVTASLSVHYVNNLSGLFKEVNRVLKKNGVFLFSTGNPVIYSANVEFNKKDFKFRRIIGSKSFKSGKRIIWGDYFDESPRVENFSPDIKVKWYKHTYETYIKTLIKNGFEIVDYVDCKPIKSAKKIDKYAYEKCMKLPTFCIFKVRKK